MATLLVGHTSNTVPRSASSSTSAGSSIARTPCAIRVTGSASAPRTDSAPAWTIANLRAGFEQRSGRWIFREFARLNNLANVNYVGTVIVGDTNGRYFEPAATRNLVIGISVSATL